MSTKATTLQIKQGNNKTAIVFIHGFSGAAEKTWGDFPSFLKDEPCLQQWDIYSIGYDSTARKPDLLVGLWSAEPSLDVLAKELKARLEDDFKKYDRLVIIAHSMGGLITQRAILDTPQLRNRIHAVFMFGTPSNGLQKAKPFSFWKRQVRDMAQDSKFITTLREKWSDEFIEMNPVPFIFKVIGGSSDEFVPVESSLQPFDSQYQVVVPGDHLEIVKPLSNTSLSVKVVVNALCANIPNSDAWNSARVAIQFGRFQEAIKLFEGNRDKIDQDAAVEYALALEGVGRQKDAITYLQDHAESTDAQGVLAGRLKRRWLAERQENDGAQSLSLYNNALTNSLSKNDYQQAYYHAINVAFMELAYKKDSKKAEGFAQDALAYCEKSSDAHWKYATQGEASLILGKFGNAIEYYLKELERNPTPREIISMYQQAIKIAEIMNIHKEKQYILDFIFRGK